MGRSPYLAAHASCAARISGVGFGLRWRALGSSNAPTQGFLGPSAARAASRRSARLARLRLRLGLGLGLGLSLGLGLGLGVSRRTPRGRALRPLPLRLRLGLGSSLEEDGLGLASSELTPAHLSDPGRGGGLHRLRRRRLRLRPRRLRLRRLRLGPRLGRRRLRRRHARVGPGDSLARLWHARLNPVRYASRRARLVDGGGRDGRLGRSTP